MMTPQFCRHKYKWQLVLPNSHHQIAIMLLQFPASKKGLKMKAITLIIVAAIVPALCPAQAGEPAESDGTVVIGVRGDPSQEVTWRPFDPSNGKLLPFKLVDNIATESKKQFSALFSGLGRLGRRDKRYDNSKVGVSYRMAELPPGTYILATVNTAKRRAIFTGPVPIVRITGGKASYAGDYTIEIDEKVGGRATALGRSLVDAQGFLAAFPKIKNPLLNAGSGTATFDCHGKFVPFARACRHLAGSQI